MTRPKLLNTRSRAADDADADSRVNIKSTKPSGTSVDLEPTALHHVTGFMSLAAGVKMEAGNGGASAWKEMAAVK